MLWMWIGFILMVLLFLAIDLGVFHRKAHVVSMKEALGWTGVWVSMALLFSVFVYFAYENHWLGLGYSTDLMAISATNPQGHLDGTSAVIKYITGYVVEESLSMDNMFVIAMLFSFFAVPPIYQHRVLFWGIIGALVMRGVMILLGAALVSKFSWIMYAFAGFLLLTAIKMLFMKENKAPGDNIIVRWAGKIWPITSKFHGEHFFVRAGTDASHEPAMPGAKVERDEAVEAVEKTGKHALMITPLFLALLSVEFTDLIFAVDSIPAIFGITTDPFLVFTSNVFAILGLRSLYFALAGLMEKFRYLKVSLAIVLMIVALKMFFHTPLKELLGPYAFNFYILGVIVLVLAGGVLVSLMRSERESPVPAPAHA
jgi:tellurite resistance protein TerC